MGTPAGKGKTEFVRKGTFQFNLPTNRALADFLPTITIKAKDFATEITIFNSKERKLSTEKSISTEHIKNNKGVRDLLLQRGIKPENLPPEEDIQRLKRRVKGEERKLGKRPGGLSE